MNSSRKGQITVFIIIGLVILLSAAVMLYIYQQRATAPIQRVVSVPEELQQVYDYVATCVDQIAKDGLIIMGTQGGYINIPPVIDRNINAYVANDPAGVSKTPYWYYEGEDRTPDLDYLTRELALYVKQNLPVCTGNFESFQPTYQITPKSDILPIITLTDNEVITEVKWQLQITAPEREMELNEFVIVHNVKLKQAHELAAKTMQMENLEGWFENLTIDLMSSNPRIPVSGMEFTCGTKKWHITQIKEELQNTMYYNLPYVRVENTNYPAPIANRRVYDNLKKEAENIREDLEAGKDPKWPENTPPDAFEMNRMMFDVGAKRSELKANFQYLPNWPLFINAQPNQGGTLSTAQMKGARKYLRFLCMNQWHFAYDVIYPIKMTVRDDTAFRGEGYNYQMAFPVIIKDNEESRKFFGLRKFQTPDTGTEFCDTIGTQSIDVRAMGFEEGIPVAIELADANITYRCLNKECLLGSTYSDGTGATRLTAYLPEGCSNPLLLANKEGYLEGKQHATGQTEIMMTKLKRLNYTVNIHPYYEEVNKDDPTKVTASRWLPEQNYNRFTKTMHATVSISLRNQPFDQYKTYPPEALSTEEFDSGEIETNTLEFVLEDAQYDIDVLLFKGDTVVGGYHAENITIYYDDLATSSNLILNVVEYRPLPDTSEKQAGMFLFLYDRGKYYDERPYWQALKPVFTP